MASPHHLLVIDDEPFVGQVVRMLFEKGPFTVSIAMDGTAGLEFLRGHPDVACALVDINMPGMGGLDVIAAAQAAPALARLKFVVLTAAGDEVHVTRARTLGVSAFVTKPFSPNKLYHQVSELLGLAAAAPAREA